MKLTPAALKTPRRKEFKNAMKFLTQCQSSSSLCVFASLRETSIRFKP